MLAGRDGVHRPSAPRHRIINKPAIHRNKGHTSGKKQVQPRPRKLADRQLMDRQRAPIHMELLSEIAFSKSSRLVISTVNA